MVRHVLVWKGRRKLGGEESSKVDKAQEGFSNRQQRRMDPAIPRVKRDAVYLSEGDLISVLESERLG